MRIYRKINKNGGTNNLGPKGTRVKGKCEIYSEGGQLEIIIKKNNE